jgi:hypothetical protein
MKWEGAKQRKEGEVACIYADAYSDATAHCADSKAAANSAPLLGAGQEVRRTKRRGILHYFVAMIMSLATKNNASK